MLTLRLTDLLLVLLTAFACAGTLYAIALMRRMNTMLDDWRRTSAKLDAVIPDIRSLCATSEEAMRSVRQLADKGSGVVEDVAEVTGQLRDVAEEGLARVQGIMGALDNLGTVVGGFKAGLAAAKAVLTKDDCNTGDDVDKETYDEEGNV